MVSGWVSRVEEVKFGYGLVNGAQTERQAKKAYQFTSSTPCGYIQKKHWIENVMGVHSKTIGCYIHLWLVGFQIALILYRQVAKETLQKGSA